MLTNFLIYTYNTRNTKRIWYLVLWLTCASVTTEGEILTWMISGSAGVAESAADAVANTASTPLLLLAASACAPLLRFSYTWKYKK